MAPAAELRGKLVIAYEDAAALPAPRASRRSIERQCRPIFIAIHAREIILGIDVSCSAKEKLPEGLESTGTQRISDATHGDVDKEPLRARNRDELEVVGEYPRPVGDEVVLREGHIRIAASYHLGKITMHYADATWKVRYLRGKEGVGRGLSNQGVNGSAVPGTSAGFASIR